MHVQDSARKPSLHKSLLDVLQAFGWFLLDSNGSAVEQTPVHADVMRDKHVLMHQNHGVIVVGATVAETFYRLYYLEQAARIANKALALGRPLSTIPDQVIMPFCAVELLFTSFPLSHVI